MAGNFSNGQDRSAAASPSQAAPEQAIGARRSAARIELLDTDRHFAHEVAAFDVLVNGVVCGYWAQTADGGSVKWTQGESSPTGDCGGESARIIAAVRETIPPAHLPGDGR